MTLESHLHHHDTITRIVLNSGLTVELATPLDAARPARLTIGEPGAAAQEVITAEECLALGERLLDAGSRR